MLGGGDEGGCGEVWGAVMGLSIQIFFISNGVSNEPGFVYLQNLGRKFIFPNSDEVRLQTLNVQPGV